MKLPKRLKNILRVLTRMEEFDGPVCDFCTDDANWVGVDPADRQDFCGPEGLNCPGFEGEGEGG